MVTKDEVEKFLSDFKTKLEIFDVHFLDERNKNTQALAELDITSNQRKECLKKLRIEDYSSGPNIDKLDLQLSEYWEFGIQLKKKEIYIKIRIGKSNSSVICISFHPSERKMKYPYKKGR